MSFTSYNVDCMRDIWCPHCVLGPTINIIMIDALGKSFSRLGNALHCKPGQTINIIIRDALGKSFSRLSNALHCKPGPTINIIMIDASNIH
jgi:hypothetical protein